MALRFNPVVIPDAATYTVKEYNSGLLHVFPDLTADCTVTLPTPKAGLSYRFMYGGAAADAQDWLITAGTGNAVYFVGGVVHNNTTADAAAAAVFSDGNSNELMTVLVPAAGTLVEIISNGSVWYVTGNVVAASAPTFAD